MHHMSEQDINLKNPASVIAGLTELRDLDAFNPGSLAVIFADHDALGVCTAMIDDVPDDPPQTDRVDVLASLLGCTTSHGLGSLISGFLLAHERPGTDQVRGHDLAWHDAAATVADETGFILYGNYVVTDDGVARVVVPEPVC